MFAVVKNVRSWRNLGKEMGYSSLVLNNIQQQYDSDEDCLKALVERFLKDGSLLFNQPSWRAVIWCLYEANEFQLAEQIRSYAEPVQGTMYSDIVLEDVQYSWI